MSSCASDTVTRVCHLLTEYLTNPLGIDDPNPGFSWRIESDRRGFRQTAYQVQVASSKDLIFIGNPDLWDSGKVVSSDQVSVRYAGYGLASRAICYWRARVWDENDVPTEFSEPAVFEMALLDPKDWVANWITTGDTNSTAPLLRREFELNKPVSRARAYVTGLGYYELWLNGRRVGNRVLDPPYTSFDKRVYYSVYDVTKLLKRGANCVGAMLGRGWWDKEPRLLVQIEVTHNDGSTKIVTTDTNWRWAPSPIIENSIYHGETYDARLEQPGWNKPGFDDSSWSLVTKLDEVSAQLSVQTIQPIKVVQTLKPKSVNEVKPGIWVFDLGQNFSGWCRIKVSGPVGTAITLKHAENLYPDDTVNQENLRSAKATDTYILRGEGTEVYEPKFTYHGFRYVQVEGLPEKPAPDSIQGRVVHTAIEPIGTFSCSNRLINRIQNACVWGERTNFHAVPTDCPQRDERQGWMGDAHISAYAMLYNFNMPPAYTKFLRDIQDAQGEDGRIPDTVPHVWGSEMGDPMWSAAYPIILWRTYLHTGDKSLLKRHYDGVKRYVEMLRREAGDSYIITRNEYGDWIAVVETPKELISTGAFILVTDLLSKMARALDNRDDGDEYETLRAKIAAAFNSNFFDETTSNYGNSSQLSNALPLAAEIVPCEHKERVLANLIKDIEVRQGHLSTGFVGTPILLEALTKSGRADLAYTIVTQKDYPGWGYMIANGATTIWELWNYEVGPGMNSHNHPTLGFVSGWFYEALAGLVPDSDHPGWEHFIVKPHVVGNLKWANGRVETVRGVVESTWRFIPEGFALSVKIPHNATATVFVPTLGKQQFEITESGHIVFSNGNFIKVNGVVGFENDGKWVTFDVGAGSYEFVLTSR
ncbi:MAG: glycoside hydrolase family 78 protein [Armatimonadetes bacterium]|nr:glycoside hydrolase family 78 protein [Armatimonadota bacterium]